MAAICDADHRDAVFSFNQLKHFLLMNVTLSTATVLITLQLSNFRIGDLTGR